MYLCTLSNLILQEIGDFGSLLVFSKNKNDTDSIIYTWDEGTT